MDNIRENGVRLRRAAISDASRIQKIDAENFKIPYSLNVVIETTLHDIVFTAVDESDTVLGYIIGVNNFDSIDIIRIAVDERHKRRGIGGMLLREIIDGYPELDFFLEVRENNAPAIALYEKLGFRQVGIRKGFYSEYEPPVNAITMKYYK
jgi:ribosomal-protein-alanine N-acetyltransferase